MKESHSSTSSVPPRLIAALLVVVAVFFTPVAAAQPASFSVESWEFDRGLPQNNIFGICQTPDGYIWVGTLNGLARFNGIKFEKFNTSNTPELESDSINKLAIDANGRLLIGTTSGLVTYEKGRFSRWQKPVAMSNANVRAFAREPDGSTLATTDRGVWKISGIVAEEIHVPGAIWPNRASLATRDDRGQVWVAHQNKLFSLQGPTLRLAAEFDDTLEAMDPMDGGLFLRTSGKGSQHYEWQTNGSALRIELPKEAVVRQLFRTSKGERFLVTRNVGLVQWLSSNPPSFRKVPGLETDRLSDLMEDHEGNLWVGTDGNGLCRLTRNKVTAYGREQGLADADGLTDPEVPTLCQDRAGNIWVGILGGGLCVGKEGAWSRFRNNNVFGERDGVTSLLESRDGTVWVGRLEDPLVRIRNRVAELEPLSQIRSVRALFEDKDGRLWVGSREQGVECFDPTGNSVEKWSVSNGLSDNCITGFAQGKDGTIWVATVNGLNRIRSGRVEIYGLTHGIGAKVIQCLLVDSEGTLWLGTSGGGLTRFRNDQFKSVTSRHGLYADAVNQLVEGTDKDLWMASPVGVFRTALKDLNAVLDEISSSVRCRAFGRKDGMRSTGCPGGTQPSSMRTADGRLWFGTSKGIAVFDPRKLHETNRPPVVHIEKLIVDGIPIVEGAANPRLLASSKAGIEGDGDGRFEPGAGGDVVYVPPSANRIEFHCAGLSFSEPTQVQFQFWLENYEKDWDNAGTRSIAYYNRVPPGSYRFHVKASNSSGVWSARHVRLNVILRAHYWQTLWFKGLIACGVGGAVALVVILRRAAKAEVNALRTRIARDLHDEVGANLGSIALLTEIALQSGNPKTEIKEINDVTVETAELVREVVNLANPGSGTMEQMLGQMEALARRMLKQFNVSFDVRSVASTRPLPLKIRRNLVLIFKEALHNILKHSKARRVQIRVFTSASQFQLHIEDDGKGFDGSKVSKGLGLDSMSHRARLIGGTLIFSRAPTEGTIVTLDLPLE